MEIISIEQAQSIGPLWKEIANALQDLDTAHAIKIKEEEWVAKGFKYPEALRVAIHKQFPKKFTTKVDRSDGIYMYIMIRK